MKSISRNLENKSIQPDPFNFKNSLVVIIPGRPLLKQKSWDFSRSYPNVNEN